MTDGYTTLNPGTGGDKIDSEHVDYGGDIRKRQRLQVVGNTTTQIAAVTNGTPSTTDYGLVVKSAVTGDETPILLRKLIKILESVATVDLKTRQKVVVEAIGNSSGTPTELAATIPVANTPVAGAINMGNVVIQFGAQATAAAVGVDSRFFMMDTARNAYANGIRANLVWSA